VALYGGRDRDGGRHLVAVEVTMNALLLWLVLLLALAAPALAGRVRCLTYEGKIPRPAANPVQRRHASPALVTTSLPLVANARDHVLGRWSSDTPGCHPGHHILIDAFD
jgi:hypothetical protein